MTIIAPDLDTPTAATAAEGWTDDLTTTLLLRVARRADVLASGIGSERADGRRIWLRAECEVLEQMERRAPSVLGLATAESQPVTDALLRAQMRKRA